MNALLLMLLLLGAAPASTSSSENAFSRCGGKRKLLSTRAFVLYSSATPRFDRNETESSVTSSVSITCAVSVLPRGGGFAGSPTNESVGGVDRNKGSFDQGAKKSDKPRRITRARYKLLRVASRLLGRTAKKLLGPVRQQTRDGDDVIDHTFDELDRILDKTNDIAISPGNDEEWGSDDNATWLEAWPPLPQAASLLKGWKKRTLRGWMNKVHLSTDTVKALETIRSIIRAFPDYGVVDLVGMYR